jgi:hypothetical protein
MKINRINIDTDDVNEQQGCTNGIVWHTRGSCIFKIFEIVAFLKILKI